MTKEITLKTYALDKPAEMSKMAVVLKYHIINNKLFTNIQGKNYVNVEGWEFAGFLTGLVPRIESVENLSNASEIKWKATVNIYQGDRIMGTGIALCSNKEKIKAKFDEYAVLSMAQTRAIGKAYRNLMGWVIKLAGYESTPAEEIKDTKETDLYSKAVSMIKACKTESAAVNLGERIDKSKKFTDEQKKELTKLASSKADELSTQDEK